MDRHLPFGIDFGGSGIKGAPVDLEAGDFAADRVRIKTPKPSTPEAVAEVFVELLGAVPGLDAASVGVTVPAVVRHGVVELGRQHRPGLDRHRRRRAVHQGHRPRRPRRQRRRRRRPGRGAGTARRRAARGLVIVTTLGTGIGSAIVYDGVLVPNSELGHLEIDGHDAENRAASSVKEQRGPVLPRVGRAARRSTTAPLEKLFSPDLFVVGGGVSKDSDRVPAPDRHRDRDRARPRCRTGPASSAPRSGPPRRVTSTDDDRGATSSGQRLLDVVAQVGGLGQRQKPRRSPGRRDRRGTW